MVQKLSTAVQSLPVFGDCLQERKFNMYTSYWIDHLATKVFVETEEAQEFLRVRVDNMLYCFYS